MLTASSLYSQSPKSYRWDTIELENGETVRYIGIDTPETKHPEKAVEYYGQEAYEANKNLVEGKTVCLEFDVQERDKYGRLLAYVYLEDGTFVNAWLVENGYAQIATYPPNVKYQELFLELQIKAREKNKGLWAEALEEEVTLAPDKEEDVTVYITRTGKKYHRAGCGYLSRSMIPISLKEAVSRGYTPCSRCNPPKVKKEAQEEQITPAPAKKKEKDIIVYITRTGKKYHRAGCSYLRKSSIPISLKDAKSRGYTPCSRCNPPIARKIG